LFQNQVNVGILILTQLVQYLKIDLINIDILLYDNEVVYAITVMVRFILYLRLYMMNRFDLRNRRVIFDECYL